MRHKRLSIALILLLAIVLMLEIFQPIIGHARGAVNMWQSAGGVGNIKNSAASTKGTWLNTMQGFRITVLNDNGDPSFVFCGKDHLDLLFSEQNLTKCNIYGVSHKTGDGRVAVASLDELKSVNYLYTISGLTSAMKSGAITTLAPCDNVIEAINNLANLPHHLEGSEFTGSWNKMGSAIKGKLYGPSEDEIMDTAGFYALFNVGMGDTYLWQPKGGFKDGEEAKLSSGKMSMIQVMANHEVTISVEPILWNPLRISGTQWSGYFVYGTQTDIGYAIDKLVAAGKFSSENQAMGGWDEVLFGAGGRSAMVTTKEYKFKGGLTIAVPPQGQSGAVTNKMVMVQSPGWSLHLYTLKPREDEPEIPTTSTCDEPDHPITDNPPKRKPHPSQNPFDDPDPSTFDPETTHVEPDNPYTHYRIVKCYETEKYKEDGVSLLERTSDGVFITEPTNPIVDIEDEKASEDEFDGSWHLKDWDVSDNFNPPLPDLWAALKETYTSKQHGTTEADGISLIDENDEEKVVTLYVHLLRKIKEDEPPEEEETGGTGNIIIQQSQISKTIHTNDKGIGGIWGNYTFKTQPAANFTLGGF